MQTLSWLHRFVRRLTISSVSFGRRRARIDRAGCYGYGFYYLECDGRQYFRWSRRTFGFYLLPAVQVAVVRLGIEALHPTTLTLRIGGTVLSTRKVTPRTAVLVFHLPKLNRSQPCAIEFELADTFAPLPADSRPALGVKLKWLGVEGPGGSLVYPVTGWRHNPAPDVLERCWVSQETGALPSRASAAPENGAHNASERQAEVPLASSLPVTLYLELCYSCNLRCPSCFHAYLDPRSFNEATHFMSPHLYRRIAQELFPGALAVYYNGNGESFLHPNITEILRAARDHSFIPAILTNGTRFNEENMRLLVEEGYRVIISIDSPYQRDFERLRQGASYARLVAAIDYMQSLRERLDARKFTLTIQCVASQSNLSQLGDLVSWAAQHGIREVQFLPLMNWPGNAYLESQKLELTPARADLEMLRAVRTGTGAGVRVWPFPPVPHPRHLPGEWEEALAENRSEVLLPDPYLRQTEYIAPHPANEPSGRCYKAWSECSLLADGTVTPCSLLLKQTPVGNLYDAGFRSIWNSRVMQDLRSTVNRAPAGVCRPGACPFRSTASGSPFGQSNSATTF